jgi:hypothetical protein
MAKPSHLQVASSHWLQPAVQFTVGPGELPGAEALHLPQEQELLGHKRRFLQGWSSLLEWKHECTRGSECKEWTCDHLLDLQGYSQ